MIEFYGAVDNKPRCLKLEYIAYLPQVVNMLAALKWEATGEYYMFHCNYIKIIEVIIRIRVRELVSFNTKKHQLLIFGAKRNLCVVWINKLTFIL